MIGGIICLATADDVIQRGHVTLFRKNRTHTFKATLFVVDKAGALCVLCGQGVQLGETIVGQVEKIENCGWEVP